MSAQTGPRALFTEANLQSLPSVMAGHTTSDAIVFFEKGHEEHWIYAQVADDAERLAQLALTASAPHRAVHPRHAGVDRRLRILRSGAVPVLLDTQMAMHHVHRDSSARCLFTTSTRDREAAGARARGWRSYY